MSFESAITIILTALGVMLAVLALIMAIFAFWGYVGFKDFVKEAAKTHVADAMAIKMKEYPGGAEVSALMKELKDRADLLEGFRNQLVTPPAAKPVEIPPNTAIQQVTPIAAKYPGEEEHRDANGTGPARTDPRPDNS